MKSRTLNVLSCNWLYPNFAKVQLITQQSIQTVPVQRRVYLDTPMPDLLTEEELIIYLRIPEVSKAGNYHNVIANLKRMKDLPCIHISRQPLYPLEAVRGWIRNQVEANRCN